MDDYFLLEVLKMGAKYSLWKTNDLPPRNQQLQHCYDYKTFSNLVIVLKKKQIDDYWLKNTNVIIFYYQKRKRKIKVIINRTIISFCAGAADSTFSPYKVSEGTYQHRGISYSKSLGTWSKYKIEIQDSRIILVQTLFH